MQAHEHYTYLYDGTPMAHIDWRQHRWPLAVQEIAHYNPDVLCLQEVTYEMSKYGRQPSNEAVAYLYPQSLQENNPTIQILTILLNQS